MLKPERGGLRDQGEYDACERGEPRGIWAMLELSAPCKRPPKLGMRTVKTVLVVALTLLLYWGLAKIWPNRESGAFLAMIAGIVAMQETVGHSLSSGVVRVFGTAFGGLLGILLTLGAMVFPASIQTPVRIVAICIGTLLCIYLGNWLNFQKGIVIGLVVLLAILLKDENFSPLGSVFYALNRVLDTLIGIVLSILVNLTIRPPKWE